MSGRLILLARRFPYNHGEVAAESYLEAEIGFLAKHFDSVLAVATEASSSDSLTCALPDNVEPLPLGCAPTKVHKLILSARGQAYAFSAPKRVRDAMESDPVVTMKQRLFRGYFVARAQEKYAKLTIELQSRKFVPTSIYSFWFYDIALVAFWLKGYYRHTRAITRAHRYDLYRDCVSVDYLPFRELLLSGLDMILPCSEDGHAYIDSNWPGHSGKLLTAYLGTTDLPDNSGSEKANIFHVVSCSRIVSVKRVGLIADAMRILNDEGIHVYWTHYGDGPEKQEIAHKCSEFKSVIVHLPGKIPNAKLLQLYGTEHIDLFVNVSASEGLPISIMEACGIGAPILATDVGGTHEIVRNGVNGILLPANPDAIQIARAIKEFVNMSDRDFHLMRQASRHIWEQNFRTENNVNILIRLLKGSVTE